jgi:hypothetical protein
MAGKSKDRTDPANSPVKKVAGMSAALVRYTEQDASLAGMDEYRILPRLKIIQAMADPALKEKFGEGTAIIRPGDAEVWRKNDEPFAFVPALFVVEFAQWADPNDSESNTIIKRTFDPTSELAKKARDPEKRIEPYKLGSEQKYRYVEHLRFYGQIYGDIHPLSGTPVVLSFERGEFTQGKNFISAIKLRRQPVQTDSGTRIVPVPLWAQIWSLSVGFRDRAKDRRWYGFDFASPEISIIKDEQVEEFHKLHLELKELQEKNRLMVDEQDRDVAATPADSKEF